MKAATGVRRSSKSTLFDLYIEHLTSTGVDDKQSDPLYPAMKNFWNGKQPIRYTDNVIVFRHVYAAERPERLYRDHDNIEVNKVVDIVALYVMNDDSPMRCRHYYCSASGSTDRTEVYVIPQREFGSFLGHEDTIPKKGVMLYENIPKGRKKRM